MQPGSRSRIKRNSEWRQTPGADDVRELELPDAGPGPRAIYHSPAVGNGRAGRRPRRSGGRSRRLERARVTATSMPMSAGSIINLGELQLELQRLGKREQAAEARQIHEQGSADRPGNHRPPPSRGDQDPVRRFRQALASLRHRPPVELDQDRTVREAAAAIDQSTKACINCWRSFRRRPTTARFSAALTSELPRATSRAARGRSSTGTRPRRCGLLAVRPSVRQHAADLDETVRSNASLATIVEEYEEFDRAWHNLLDRARLAPEIDAHAAAWPRTCGKLTSNCTRPCTWMSRWSMSRQHLVNLATSIMHRRPSGRRPGGRRPAGRSGRRVRGARLLHALPRS